MAIILVDFDGTCIPTLPVGCTTDYETGAEIVLRKLINCGHKIVLWTARNNSQENPYNVVSQEFMGITSLKEAENWFKDKGIELYGVNEVPGEVDKIGIGRKALGDYLIDDTALGTPIKFTTIKCYSRITETTDNIKTYHVDWIKLEEILKQLDLIHD